jgi:hypothetical protein
MKSGVETSLDGHTQPHVNTSIQGFLKRIESVKPTKNQQTPLATHAPSKFFEQWLRRLPGNIHLPLTVLLVQILDCLLTLIDSVFVPKNKLEISLTQEPLCKLKQPPEPFMISVVCLVLMCSLSVHLVTNTTSDQDQNVTPAVLNAAENRALVLRELGKHYFTY